MLSMQSPHSHDTFSLGALAEQDGAPLAAGTHESGECLKEADGRLAVLPLGRIEFLPPGRPLG